MKKRDLICKIEYEIKQIENDIAESKSDSECEKRQNDDTAENQEILNTSIQVIKENDKEELPAWMKLFLERSNKSKPSDEEVIPTVSGRTPNDDSDEITTPKCCSKENEMIEVELLDTNEKCENDDALKKAGLQSKIKQLKDIFNVQTSKSPSSSKRVSHFISTQSIKEKFENNVKTQETKSLMKSPNKKLIDLSQYFNIETTDGTNKKPSEIEKMKWKYQEKPRDSNLQNFNLIEKADNINFDDINHEKVFRENVQKYLDLIDESETDSKMLSSKPLKKELPISQLDKSKLQDLFKDQDALTRSKTSKLMVNKLSKSLNFLNEPSSESIGQTRKVKEELKKMSGAETLRKDFFAAKDSSQCEELIKNRVSRKIIQNPFNNNYLKSKEDTSRIRPTKVWRPKIIPMKMVQNSMTTKVSKDESIRKDAKSKDPILNIFNEIGVNRYTKRNDNTIETENNHEDDMEEILNYEDSEEIRQYEADLRQKYSLDYGSSSEDSIHEKSSMKPSDSFSSLMNILSTMRKSKLSKSVSACKLNLFGQINQEKCMKKNIDIDVELPSNSDLKRLYNSSLNTCNDTNKEIKRSLEDELNNIRSSRSLKVMHNEKI